MSARAHRSTPSVMENAATSAATPMMTPVVDSVVRMGLVRKESAPTRADSIIAAPFTLKRLMRLRSSASIDDQLRHVRPWLAGVRLARHGRQAHEPNTQIAGRSFVIGCGQAYQLHIVGHAVARNRELDLGVARPNALHV